MKLLLIASFLFFSGHAMAADQTSYTGSDNEIKPIPSNEIAWRLHIDGEIFFVSPDGEKLISVADEHREWEFNDQDRPLITNWRFEGKGLPVLALRQKWTLDKSGKITVLVQQYSDFERVPGDKGEVKFGKLLREQTFVVKDFSPINWEMKDSSRKMVVRLTPGLWPNEKAADVGALPFSGKHMTIFDDSGRVWADQVEVDSPAPYFGVITHLGTISLSYVQFKGSSLLGTAKNGRIRIRDGKEKITIMSETPFVPNQAKVNVYGVINRNRKSESLNSYRSYNSSDEEKFIKRVVEAN